MLTDNLVASHLSDYNTARLDLIRCLIGHFESYLEDMYDNCDYSFAEYLTDLDQDLLLSEFDEIIRRKLCLTFSTTVELQKESEVYSATTCQSDHEIQ
jgi:hypothetical protein